MMRPLFRLVFMVVLASQPLSRASAQMAGSRLGVEDNSPRVENLPRLDRETAESFIAIEGSAELRVRPTQIRIVLAITAEGKAAQDCQRTVQENVAGLKSRWSKLRIAPENMVEDFIAILPLHEWNLEKRGDSEVGVEQRVGFRMQTNI
ncbi:MAG: SIMPL domain-containing protein, partial [Pirellulaceae bacterium]